MARVWPWLVAGPVLFLVMIVAVSVAVGIAGVPPDQIGLAVAAHGSIILVVVLAVLGALVWWRLPVRALWAGTPGRATQDVVIGGAVGVALAVGYLVWLAPGMTWAQTNLGDYVPPGAVMATVSGQVALFFVANVLLAPFVEETLYRGFALQALMQRSGRVVGVVLSCLAFGALHWTGGIWYMVLTGVVAGGAFAALALRRGGLLAPFAAHLTLNVIEFAASL